MKNYFSLKQSHYTLARFLLNSFLYIIILLVGTSCEDFLEEDPKSIAVETFYNTSKEVEAAVNAIYISMRVMSDAGIWGINSCLGEFCYGRGSWAALNNYEKLNDTWIGRVGGVWSPFYLSIRNANLVILNAPQGTSISQDDIDRFVCEAKFLRGFAYFQLVRSFGGVPIRTENNIEEPNVPRSTINDVYDLILADLLIAEANLPDEPRLIGAPSKWAVKTLLADVYLNLKMFPEARDKALEVINSNKFSLVPVTTVDDFQKIFGPDVLTTSEEIFYFKYHHLSGNVWPGLLNHPKSQFYGNYGVYGVHSYTTNKAYQNWDDNDLRKGLWYPFNIGLGPNTLLSKKYIDPETSGLYGGANSLQWYRYADVLMIFAEASCQTDGPTVDAMEALNQVHRRAYGYDPTSPSPVDFNIGDYNATTFSDLIFKERGYEFQVEGKRWPELVRTGRAEEVILDVFGKLIPDLFYLWPIPVKEFTYNKSLSPEDQNPGY